MYCLNLALINFLCHLNFQLVHSSISSTPTHLFENDPSCHIWHMSCHKLDTASAPGSFHNICKGVIDLLCLMWVLCYPLLTFWWLSLCQIGMTQLYCAIWWPVLSVLLFFSPISTCLHWSLAHHYVWWLALFIISSRMHLSLSPWINCSFICLSNSLLLHSAAAMHSLPIHLSVLSFSRLYSFLNCRGFTVSLYWGLNLVASISNQSF